MKRYFAVISFALCSCGSSENNLSSSFNANQLRNANHQDIPHRAVTVGLSDLASFIYMASLTTLLSSNVSFTVFAPSNLAFFELPAASRKELFLNKTLLKELLEYHLVKGRVYCSQFQNEQLLPSVLPRKYIRMNLYKKNTVITASGAVVFKVDQNASNGVIQPLQSVMIPPVGTITYFIQSMTGYSVLVKAIRVTGLEQFFKGSGPFTMFAPSDAAFSKLQPSEIQNLMNKPKVLTNLLLYHVLNGTVYTAGFSNNEKLQTWNNNTIVIQVTGDCIKINGATLSMPDMTVTNGVIHEIDSVLFPP